MAELHREFSCVLSDDLVSWTICHTLYTGKAWHQCADGCDRAKFSALEIAFCKPRSHNAYHCHHRVSLCTSQVRRWQILALCSALLTWRCMKALNLRKQCATTGNTMTKHRNINVVKITFNNLQFMANMNYPQIIFTVVMMFFFDNA